MAAPAGAAPSGVALPLDAGYGRLPLHFEPAAGGKTGDFVVLRALIDCIVVFSTCPMDLVPINGPDMTPKAVHYEVWERSAGGHSPAP